MPFLSSLILSTDLAAGQNISFGTGTYTAHAGGGQASATPITTTIAKVTTVASANDSVALPAAVIATSGTNAATNLNKIVLINAGANPMQVFGTGTDTINGVAAATGISQPSNSIYIYVCAATGLWHVDIAGGYAGGFPTQGFAGGLTAHAGGGQGSGTPITAPVSRFTTVATIADSATLPATVANISIGPLTIINAAANSMNLFPASGDQINALGANAAFAIAAGKTASLYSTGSGQWHALLSA